MNHDVKNASGHEPALRSWAPMALAGLRHAKASGVRARESSQPATALGLHALMLSDRQSRQNVWSALAKGSDPFCVQTIAVAAMKADDQEGLSDLFQSIGENKGKSVWLRLCGLMGAPKCLAYLMESGVEFCGEDGVPHAVWAGARARKIFEIQTPRSHAGHESCMELWQAMAEGLPALDNAVKSALIETLASNLAEQLMPVEPFDGAIGFREQSASWLQKLWGSGDLGGQAKGCSLLLAELALGLSGESCPDFSAPNPWEAFALFAKRQNWNFLEGQAQQLGWTHGQALMEWSDRWGANLGESSFAKKASQALGAWEGLFGSPAWESHGWLSNGGNSGARSITSPRSGAQAFANHLFASGGRLHAKDASGSLAGKATCLVGMVANYKSEYINPMPGFFEEMQDLTRITSQNSPFEQIALALASEWNALEFPRPAAEIDSFKQAWMDKFELAAQVCLDSYPLQWQAFEPTQRL